MGIDSITRKQYMSGILEVVQDNVNPLSVPQVLEQVQTQNLTFHRDIAAALLWHMLATHQLELNDTKKIEVPHTLIAR